MGLGWTGVLVGTCLLAITFPLQSLHPFFHYAALAGVAVGIAGIAVRFIEILRSP